MDFGYGDEGRRRWTLISDGDLTQLILCRLPAKSVLRFRSVCRRWLELMSEPSFLLSHTLSNPRPLISGLILPSQQDFQVHRLPGRHHHPGPAPSFIDRLSAAVKYSYFPLDDHDSCNGLILFNWQVPDCHCQTHYYVCNPTTNDCRQIPDPPTPTPLAVSLFFDPSSPVCRHPSLHYRLVCIGHNSNQEYEILVYSSHSGSWRYSRNPFPSNLIYFSICTSTSSCGGAVHWLENLDILVSFQMETEELVITPSPTDGLDTHLKYICSSRDRLHLIEISRISATILNVFHLNADYSGWTLLYCIDNLSVATIEQVWFLGLVDEEETEGKGTQDLLFLALKNRGSELISYNLERSSYNKVNYLPGEIIPYIIGSSAVFFALSLFSP